MSPPLSLVGKLALLSSMRRGLCHCCNGNCCSCHNGVIAVVDAQACLCHCQASIVALATCCQAGVVTHVAMAPSMRRIFAIVVIAIFVLMIAIFVLMTMALLLVSMHIRPCSCQDGVVTLVTMALLPLILNGVVTLIAMVLLLSSSWHHCPAFNCRRLQK